MERRRFHRQPISLSALVHPPEGRSWLCHVRDFCEDGMLLAGSSGQRFDAESTPSGTAIALHFSVASPDGQKHFRTQPKIVRFLNEGTALGVQFDGGMPDTAYDALRSFTVAAGYAAPEPGSEDDEIDEIELYEATPPGAPGFTNRDRPDATTKSDDAAAADSAAAAAPAHKQPPAPAGSAAKPRPAARAGTARQPAAKQRSGKPDEHALRDRRLTEEQARAIRERMLTVTERALGRFCNQLLATTQERLLTNARDAGTNAAQTLYFEGLDSLEKSETEVRADFTRRVLEQIRSVSDLDTVMERRRRREGGSPTKLELVDTEDFEAWLGVAEVISKAENRFEEPLFDLRAQLGLIAKPWSHKDVIPVGPAVLTWAFDDTIAPLAFRRQVRDDLYDCFSETLYKSLGNLYAALNQLLEDSRAFPPLDELRDNLARGRIRRTASGVKVDSAAYAKMDAPTREAAMAADGVGSQRVDYNPFVEAAGGDQVYGTARSLLNVGRTARQLMGQPREEMLARPDAAPNELFNSREILTALAHIESELGDASLTDERLKPRLMQVLRQQHGNSKAFSEDDFDTLDVMDNLVESIESDRLLTEGIREWVKRLEITLHKLATRDPNFLAYDPQAPHGAVRMLNQLARLGNSRDVRDGIDREVGARVDELLQKVVSEYDSNPEVFDEVVDELNPLIDRQTRTYRGNIERTVRASEGQQKLARARRHVVEAVADHMEGQQVPDLVAQLLNPGWRNLLVHTHLRHGPDSNEWRDTLGVVKQLNDQLSGKVKESDPAFVAPDALLRRIVDGLNSISFDPSKRTPLIMKLSAALVGDTTGRKAPVQSQPLEEGQAANLLGLEGLLPEVDPDIETQDSRVRESWDSAVRRARRIQVGEWLATSDARGRPLILSVAFVGDEQSAFVLVNRKGIKARELSLKEMADGLHEGQITLLDDYDLPLMERASQRMLENMHSRLAYQSSHDELTQLVNRREFERLVEQSLKESRTHEVQHALLYVDLDQFKIVNNTSGHKAGDELLKQIGDTLARALQGHDNATLARLGGDEFGVLLKEVETQAAREQSEGLLQAVRDQRFEWDGRTFNLSASMGLVFLDATTENVDTAMRHADEACYSAKDAGRNRLQEYELGDARMMQRHGIMEWVSQLDKALDDDRFVLNCQRIAPVADPDALDHYEILLTMRDELGDIMPPTDFILAAETYNRMTLVDRWVIERVLQWMADNRSRLDHSAGFSINVSGHSVNDETFPDFVLEQFSKTQAPTGKVCFEITETAAIANLENAIDFMNRMKIIGCRFSLDDFGTGLSSYSYLRHLPVDYVKIDGVFVKGIVDNPGDQAIVRSINEIAHHMGKKTIAEFVENQSVFEYLRDIGVDFVQGYEVDRPLLLEELRL
ncbi:MAG: DUF1631 family protein [Pseudomonadota bacterium]